MKLLRILVEKVGQKLLVSWLISIELTFSHIPGCCISRHDVVRKHLRFSQQLLNLLTNIFVNAKEQNNLS